MADSSSLSGGLSSRHGGFMMNCGCGVPSKVRIVTKQNHNLGRKFRGCGKYPETDCGYFSWLSYNGEAKCGSCEQISQKLDEFGKEMEALTVRLHDMKARKEMVERSLEGLAKKVHSMTVKRQNDIATRKLLVIALVVSWVFFILFGVLVRV